MADPATLTMISMGTAAAGGLVGAFGSVFGGESSARMYEYQASVARINKQVEEQNADYARHVGEVQAQESGMRTRAEVGQTLAAQGASGLDVNRGSAQAVRVSEVAIGQQNEAIIRANAARKAFGYELKGWEAGTQADLYDMSAKKAREAGFIGAATSILGAGTSVADKWLKAKEVGIFGSEGGELEEAEA